MQRRRIMGVVKAGWPLPIAAALAFAVGSAIGDMPECGTGSYIGYGIGWPIAMMLELGVIVTFVAGVAILVCGRGPVRWLALTALVPIEALAGWAGTLAGEAAGGCARYSASKADDAVWMIAVPGLVALAPLALLLAIATVIRAVRRAHRAPHGPGLAG